MYVQTLGGKREEVTISRVMCQKWIGRKEVTRMLYKRATKQGVEGELYVAREIGRTLSPSIPTLPKDLLPLNCFFYFSFMFQTTW